MTEWINKNPDEAKTRDNSELKELTKKAMPAELMDKAWPRLHFTSEITRESLDSFVTEVKILEGSRMLGRTIRELEEDQRYDFTVTGWLRDGRRVPAPYGDRRLQQGDVLLVRTTPEELVAFRADPRVELHPVAQYERSSNGADSADPEDIGQRMVQVIVAPRSEMVGRAMDRMATR